MFTQPQGNLELSRSALGPNVQAFPTHRLAALDITEY